MDDPKQYEVELTGKFRAKFRVKSTSSKKSMDQEVRRQFLEFMDRYGIAVKIKRSQARPLQSDNS
jgi:hypothetical protein